MERAAGLVQPAAVVSSVSLQMIVVDDVLVASVGHAAIGTTGRAQGSNRA